MQREVLGHDLADRGRVGTQWAALLPAAGLPWAFPAMGQRLHEFMKPPDRHSNPIPRFCECGQLA